MNKPTRWYSNRQEKHIAKVLHGKQTANSGATAFSKGDIVTSDWLIEAKTATQMKQSFSIKKEWLKKNQEEAFAMNKQYSALAFNFGPNEDNYYVISESIFTKIVKGELL